MTHMFESDPRMSVTTTVERPDLVDLATDWIWNAFWKKLGATREDIRALVLSSDAAIGPSQCFILLVDGEPVGTCGLIASDLASRPDLTPWLAAMYVRPEARGKDYALALVRIVEAAAIKAGYSRIWLYTYVAERLYLKAGWKIVERLEENGAPAALMTRELAPAIG